MYILYSVIILPSGRYVTNFDVGMKLLQWLKIVQKVNNF